MAKTKEELNKRQADILSELQSYVYYYQRSVWPKYIEDYKDYFLNTGDREEKIKPWQHNIKVPVTKMYVDAMWTGLYDNAINFRVIGRNKEDQKKADTTKSFLEWAFAVSKSKGELMASAKEAMITGSGYLKTGYVDRVKKYSWKTRGGEKESVIKEQYPYVGYVSIFNIFYSPLVKRLSDAPRIYQRSIFTEEQIKKKLAFILEKQYDGNQEVITNLLKACREKSTIFCSYDFNLIKSELFWNKKKKVNPYIHENGKPVGLGDKVDFEEKYYEVIEVYSDDEYDLLINGNLVYSGVTPLPINQKPFVDIQYNRVP